MDTGHYNCRDYDVSPHFAPTTLISHNRAPPLYRHESYDELEQRSRSPASVMPKFPLLRLPLELRQHIYSFLIPHTQELKQSNPLGSHARNFSAVQKRSAKGMALPSVEETGRASRSAKDHSPPPVVWVRGCTSLLAVCRQIHDEVAAMIYGHSTFLLFVTYSGITFRFRWLLPSGLAPSRGYPFLELMPEKYLKLVRKVVIHVDHVDSYTGMIKFNISGRGLVDGLRKQVSRLVLALQPGHDADESTEGIHTETLAKVIIRISSSNAVLETIKTLPNTSNCQTPNETKDTTLKDVKEMLEPFGDLAGVRDVHITGTISDEFAHELETRMKSNEPRQRHSGRSDQGMIDRTLGEQVPLCVYGNDID
ncbi:hypothetical protein AMS68_004053 [Peltaster fructicola]|uniref:F-box domain-containing protein n=1 Tax=Peltaster fructicola TaxID=286661 RepID=A0A6H0XV25_9PEZI|nr:hypothetical protein AMS68_004053 [Peltaster fructicola]